MDDRTLLPLFPLNTVLFPGGLLPLHVFEPRYRLLVEECLRDDAPFGVALIRAGAEVGDPAVPFMVGTTARIVHWQKFADGRYYLLAQGDERFRIQRLDDRRPFLRAAVDSLAATGEPPPSSLVRHVRNEAKRWIALAMTLAGEAVDSVALPEDPEKLSCFVAGRLTILPPDKQRLLEAEGAKARLEALLPLLARSQAALESIALQSHRASGPPA